MSLVYFSFAAFPFPPIFFYCSVSPFPFPPLFINSFCFVWGFFYSNRFLHYAFRFVTLLRHPLPSVLLSYLSPFSPFFPFLPVPFYPLTPPHFVPLSLPLTLPVSSYPFFHSRIDLIFLFTILCLYRLVLLLFSNTVLMLIPINSENWSRDVHQNFFS